MASRNFMSLDGSAVVRMVFQKRMVRHPCLLDGRHHGVVRGDSHLNTYRSATKRTPKALLYRRVVSRFNACVATSKWSNEYFLHYGWGSDPGNHKGAG